MLLNLSIAEFKAKRYADAAAHTAAVLERQPESIAAQLFLGSSYEQLGEHAKAIPPLEKVLAAQPRERNARLMLAEALFNLERYRDAAEHFRAASELAPENPAAWYGLGRAYDGLAEGVFRDLESENPKSPYHEVLAGDLYLKQRRYGSAFIHYHAALAAQLDLPGIHAGLATVYERTGHHDWAEIERKRELQAAPDCRNASLACDFAAGRFREIADATKSSSAAESRYWQYRACMELAQQAYERLLQLPPSLEAHLHRAKTLDAAGLYDGAAKQWAEAKKLARSGPGIDMALAWSLFRAREFTSALPIVDELLKSDSRSRDVNFLRGAILLNQDQPEQAVPALEASLRADSGFLPAHAALGRAYLETHQPALAIPHLTAGLAEDEDGSIHFSLFRAYEITGQSKLAGEAKAAYRQVLRSIAEKQRLEEGGSIAAP